MKVVVEQEYLIEMLLALKMKIPAEGMEEYEDFLFRINELITYVRQSPSDQTNRLPRTSVRRG